MVEERLKVGMIKKCRYNQNILHKLCNTKGKNRKYILQYVMCTLLVNIQSMYPLKENETVCLKTGLVWANVCHL